MPRNLVPVLVAAIALMVGAILFMLWDARTTGEREAWCRGEGRVAYEVAREGIPGYVPERSADEACKYAWGVLR